MQLLSQQLRRRYLEILIPRRVIPGSEARFCWLMLHPGLYGLSFLISGAGDPFW
jgi:hypothetical protein